MSDLVYAQREIDNLINLLADARTENMRQAAELRSLRAALKHIAWEQSENDEPHLIARAAMEEGMTSPDEREDCTGLEDSSTANPCGREDCEEGEGRT